VADDVDECAIEIETLKALTLHRNLKRNDGTRCRVPRSAFEKVTQKVCAKYNLDRSEIQIKIVFSRNKVGPRLKLKHNCTISTMPGIERHLLAAILRPAALHQTFYCAEGLELANSVIEGTGNTIGLVN
jgi:hypothetical protein